MGNRGVLIVAFAAALLVSFFAWEWYLSPEARVKRTLQSAADAVEAGDVETFLSRVSDDYEDVMHPDRASLEARLREGLERVDRLNVTLQAIEVEVDGERAAASFDLVVVAIRGEERYVVVGTPFEPDKVRANLERNGGLWLIRSVERD
jgi:hypothetical protein